MRVLLQGSLECSGLSLNAATPSSLPMPTCALVCTRFAQSCRGGTSVPLLPTVLLQLRVITLTPYNNYAEHPVCATLREIKCCFLCKVQAAAHRFLHCQSQAHSVAVEAGAVSRSPGLCPWAAVSHPLLGLQWGILERVWLCACPGAGGATPCRHCCCCYCWEAGARAGAGATLLMHPRLPPLRERRGEGFHALSPEPR